MPNPTGRIAHPSPGGREEGGGGTGAEGEDAEVGYGPAVAAVDDPPVRHQALPVLPRPHRRQRRPARAPRGKSRGVMAEGGGVCAGRRKSLWSRRACCSLLSISHPPSRFALPPSLPPFLPPSPLLSFPASSLPVALGSCGNSELLRRLRRRRGRRPAGVGNHVLLAGAPVLSARKGGTLSIPPSVSPPSPYSLPVPPSVSVPPSPSFPRFDSRGRHP